MKTFRFSPVILACSALIGLIGQAHAQSTLTNNASLSSGMSASGVRAYETAKSTNTTGNAGNASASPNAGNVGTAGISVGSGSGVVGGTNTASGGTNTIGGTTQMGNASTNQYTYNSNGQMVSTGAANGDFMGPMQPAGTIIGGATAGTAAGGMDWLKVIQVAAPIVGSLSGNDKISGLAGIVGSGAQVYGQVSSGQELNAQNYANMGNIALQAAALATKNTNIDKAAQLGNLGIGAWNAYSVMSPNTNKATASVVQNQGQMQMQPIFQAGAQQTVTALGAATSTWGTPVATTTAGTTAQSVDNYDLQGPSFVTSPRYDNSADSYDLQGQSFVTDPRVNNNLPSGLSTTTYAAAPRATSKPMASPVATVANPIASVAPLNFSVTPTSSMPSSTSMGPVSTATVSSGTTSSGASGSWGPASSAPMQQFYEAQQARQTSAAANAPTVAAAKAASDAAKAASLQNYMKNTPAVSEWLQ